MPDAPPEAALVARILQGIRVNGFMKHTPHPRQAAFMALDCREALFGGAARGGKSDALLMSALQYVDVPGYAAILFRRTYPELTAAGGLIPRSKEWLNGTGATYIEGQKVWTFPSGATLRFGHCQYVRDIVSHERGPEYQFIAFDELTTFAEPIYVRIPGSRLMRPSSGPLSKVPLRVRAGTNPGGEGHEWVKRHFLTEGKAKGRVFLPSRLKDNPSVDAVEYRKSLEMLDPVTRAQMEDGDWDVVEGGDFFKVEWFRVLEEAPACMQRVRYWDCAAGTDPTQHARTAGCLMGRTSEGLFPILDMEKFWAGPTERDRIILATAQQDGRDVPIRIEMEGGSSGIHQAQDQVRMLAGFDVAMVKPKGSKPERASPLARQAKAGNVPLVSSGAWIGDFLAEAKAFPKGRLKDQIDAASGAFLHLTQFGPIRAVTSARGAAEPTATEKPKEDAAPARPAASPVRVAWRGADDPSRRRIF